MKRGRRTTVLVLIFLIVPSLVYAQAVTTEKATLVVGHQPFTPTWSSDIVRLMKFYEKYLPNVQVEWFRALYGPPLVNNMIARKIHLSYLGDMPSLVLASKKSALETRLVGICQTDDGPSAVIMVPKDSPIKSVKELDGKRVATGFGSYLHRFAEVVQAREGIRFSLVNQPPEVAFSNLEARKIDGDARWPPHWGLALHKGIARILTTGKDYGFGFICDLVVSKEYVDKHPKVIEGWLRAELDAHEFIRKHPDKAAQLIYEAWEKKIPLEVIRNDLEYTVYPDHVLPEHIKTLKAGADFLIQQKLIDMKPDVEAWVDDRYLKAAAAR